MMTRLLARAATGPIAFLIAGTLDAGAAWAGWARARMSARLRRLRERSRS